MERSKLCFARECPAVLRSQFFKAEEYTPLYSALWESEGISKTKKLDVIKYLLEHSASTDHVANKGETVLEIAGKYLPEALQWIEHPDLLFSGEFETNIIGLSHDLY